MIASLDVGQHGMQKRNDNEEFVIHSTTTVFQDFFPMGIVMRILPIHVRLAQNDSIGNKYRRRIRKASGYIEGYNNSIRSFRRSARRGLAVTFQRSQKCMRRELMLVRLTTIFV
jgi:hypothetical protein